LSNVFVEGAWEYADVVEGGAILLAGWLEEALEDISTQRLSGFGLSLQATIKMA